MELEQWQRDFDRRVEEGRGEIQARIEGAERCCKEVEEARRRDWEELKGRMMTAEEKRQYEIDYIQRLFATLTDEYVNIIRSVGEDMRQGFAENRAEAEEGRAQLRANTEAVLRMLDRLPPGTVGDEPEGA
ncbi:MAG TPA: hypothetical protein VFJ65_04030 [Solirubrobacterales bacterium]|nr:hypothetical protein [Solirubrobacterales bacterium]